MATFLIFFLVLILYEDSAQKSFQYCTYQKITFVIQTKSLSKAMEVKKETHRDEYKEGPFFQKKYISILLSQIPWRICFFQEHSIQISLPHHAITLTQPTQGHIFVGTLFSRKLAFFRARKKGSKGFVCCKQQRRRGYCQKTVKIKKAKIKMIT